MAEQKNGIPLAGHLFYEHEEPTELQPDRYLSLFGAGDRITLDKEQALALLQVLLDDLPRLVEPQDMDDALTEDEFKQLHLVHQVNATLDYFYTHQSELFIPDIYQKARGRQEQAFTQAGEMAEQVHSWETALERVYSTLENAYDELKGVVGEMGAIALLEEEKDEEEFDEEDEDDENEGP
jgi:hypothetical protein